MSLTYEQLQYFFCFSGFSPEPYIIMRSKLLYSRVQTCLSNIFQGDTSRFKGLGGVRGTKKLQGAILYFLCSGIIGTSSLVARRGKKNIIYGGCIFRENTSFSSEKRFQMLSFQKTFHYFKYRHTYGKKYGIWQKIVFKHHSQMGKKLSLLFDFKF